MNRFIIIATFGWTLNSAQASPKVAVAKLLYNGIQTSGATDYDSPTHKGENSKNSTTGLTALVQFASGLTLGLSRLSSLTDQTTTFKVYSYVSGTKESMQSDAFDLGWTFGKRWSFGIGASIGLSSKAEIVYSNPVCARFNRIASDVGLISYFLQISAPLTKNWLLSIGGRSSTFEITYPGFAPYDRSYQTTFIGFGYLL